MYKRLWFHHLMLIVLWGMFLGSGIVAAQVAAAPATPTGAISDAEFWKQIASWLWVPLGVLLAITWQSLNKKIDDVRQLAMAALTKEEFKRELEISLRDRESLQRDVRELYSKVEGAKDTMNAKVESARAGVMEEIKEFRSEMTSALNSVREAVLHSRD